MDQKTNLIVLKTILGISPDRHLDYPIKAVHEKLPELTEEVVEGSINDLEKLRCFKVLRGDSTIMHLAILPDAIGYLREFEEREKNEAIRIKSLPQPVMQNFHFKNNYGAVGTNTGITINNSFDFNELDHLITENTPAGSTDREELIALRQKLQTITDNQIPISKGYLSSFSEAMQKHSWLTGQLTGFLLRWATGQ